VFGIEKAPMMLPMEIFSHDNSNIGNIIGAFSIPNTICRDSNLFSTSSLVS
jgi:hypothetical protein